MAPKAPPGPNSRRPPSPASGGVARNGEGGLARDGTGRPDLRLPHSQEVLQLPMVDFDLPSVEVGLDEKRRGGGVIRGEQIRRLAIVRAGVRRQPIGLGGDDQQSKGSEEGAEPGQGARP